MNKTVLLTGARGFLGSHTFRCLTQSGWEVIRCVRKRQRNDSDDIVECDLDDPTQILALEKSYRPHSIVHLGCHVGWDVDDAQLFLSNVLATGCFAYLARRWGARFIFASSVAVYGAAAQRISNDSVMQPDTAYGRSKAQGEALVAASGAEHCILRLAGIFGRHGPKHLGLNRAIDNALGGVAPTVVGAGSARRNYIYVKDAAATIGAVLERNLDAVQLVAGHEVLSVREMLQTTCDILLPGTAPLVTEGAEAADQVVSPSRVLPVSRSFRAALADIAISRQECA